MKITRSLLNDFFESLSSLSEVDILSNEGFATLADWCERQDFWRDFAAQHKLEAGWRSSAMGDPNLFALAMYRFQMRLQGGM